MLSSSLRLIYVLCSDLFSSDVGFTVTNIFSFFFFKQKTAYELRISDWSSDVCSSDLYFGFVLKQWSELRCGYFIITFGKNAWPHTTKQIGRASCRERVCQYV